jgi:hypothetical protein
MNNPARLAQSASALGAGMLGFGLGAKWGNVIFSYAIIIVVIGAVFHIWGMYMMQMKNQSKNIGSNGKSFVVFCLGLPHSVIDNRWLFIICKQKLAQWIILIMIIRKLMSR